MCGILGSFLQHPSSGFDEHLHAALRALHHRGPDDQGLETFSITGGQLTLGHTRLSIIDLSPGGHQPMHSPDERYTLVFNGEIYNYRELRQELKALGHSFYTDSDTEVLLAAWAQWREGAILRLTGMFAFAVFDRIAETLILVRDAFGIKPLFYAPTADGLLFASEMSALLTLRDEGPQLNAQRAYDYLIHQVQDSGFDTFVQDVHHVPPAHWVKVDLRHPTQLRAERWWMPSIAETSQLSFSQAAEQLRELFLDSVRLHLRSDVPLGVSLSGGLDSSAIACCMRYLEPDMDLHTFSYVAADTALSEERWINQVNSYVGGVAHKVRVSPADIEADIHDLIRVQGEPFCSTSMYAQYRVFGAARDAGVKVVLEGQGGDELLAGYHGYQGQRMRSLWERREWLAMQRFARQWRQWPGREQLSPWRALIGQLLPGSLYQFAERIVKLRPMPDWMDLKAVKRLGVQTRSHRFGCIPSARERRVMEVLLRSMSEGGLSSLLRYGDRNAMRFSIENRVPFLTLALAEFALSLPEHYLIAENGETKSIFRAAMRGIVPDALLDRRDKVGFETPMGSLVAGLAAEALKSCAPCELGMVDDARFREHLEDRALNTGRFTAQDWRLVNLSLWMQKNKGEELTSERV